MKKIIFEEKNVETINFSDVSTDDIIIVKKGLEYFGAIVYDNNSRKWLCTSTQGSKAFDMEQLTFALDWFGRYCTFFTL